MADDRETRGQPIALNPNAISTSAADPPFVSPPPGSPVYYGFQILHDVVVEGFTFGKITDFEAEACDYGDAFVVAPDDTRAGLVWEVGETPYFTQVLPPDPNRWGVWGVCFQYPMRSREDARRNLQAILPDLVEKWKNWKQAK
jgi:hypothetical protein